MGQSILSNLGIAFSGRGIHTALGLVVTALLARYLGVATYGNYVALLSFATLWQIFADGGLYLSLVGHLSQMSSPRLLRRYLSLRLFLLFLSFSFGWFVLWFFPALRSFWPAYLILAIGLIAQSISQLYMSIFQYYQTIWRATVGDLIGRLGQLASVVLLILLSPTVIVAAVVFSLATSLAYFVHFLLLPPITSTSSVRTLPSKSKIIKNSWPLGALLILNVIYFRIDILVLSYFRSSLEVGLYSFAYRLIESALFLPALLGGLLLPRLTDSLPHHPKRAGEYFSQGLLLSFLLGLAGFITITLHAEQLILLIAGLDYAPAHSILILLAPSLLIMFLGNIFGFALVALKQQKQLLLIYLSLAIGNVIANLVFIPTWGATAAALTTLGTEAIAATSAAFLVFKNLPLSLPLTSFLKATILAFTIYFFGIATFSLLPSFIHLLLILFIYPLSLVATGLLSRTHFPLLLRGYGQS